MSRDRSKCSCGRQWTDYQPHLEDDGVIVNGRFDNICPAGHRELDLLPGENIGDVFDQETGLMRRRRAA